MIDDEGLSARIGADQLGHSNVSMTQDRYMARGRIHTQVADLLDRAVATGHGFRNWVENDSDLDPIRASSRFQEILARMERMPAPG